VAELIIELHPIIYNSHKTAMKCFSYMRHPKGVPQIAKYWDSIREVSYHREFKAYTGAYKGATWVDSNEL